MNQAAISYGCLAVSVVVHGFAVLGTSASSSTPPRRPLTTELVLAPVSPVEPPPAPPPPAAPIAKPRPMPVKSQPKAAAPAPPSPAALEPEPEPELTGRTLTTTSDASWSAPAGNGAERGAALGVGIAAPRPSPRAAPPSAPPPTVPITQPLAKLSRKPAPPSLAAALERNYPSDARRLGKSGEAKVRALIDARGHATRVTVTSESSPGFGAACQKTLLQSQWTPPLGPHGEATGTFVTYRCRFQIND
jgi:TonB family protein